MTGGQDLVFRGGSTAVGPWSVVLTPEQANWTYSGLHVLTLPPGGSQRFGSGDDEALLIPLSGSVTVAVDGGESYRLAGRSDVFAGPTDHLYVPPGAPLVMSAGESSARLAICTARVEPMVPGAQARLPVRYVSADGAGIEARGGGPSARTVVDYSIDTDLPTERLLVCEVITPGGHWSSYPPHKHDAHTEQERELEEIYYVEVAGDGSGFGFYRGYGSSADRPLDLTTTVYDGDVVLVPHGYHGPVAAAPGYDLYYLNVMAGPAADGRWLAVDDPAYTWVRDTWED